MSEQAEVRPRPVNNRIQAASSPPARPVDAKRGRLAGAVTARIAATKRRLLAGGILQPVEWGVPTGSPDIRGRRTFTYSMLDALIEARPALDRGGTSTERSDHTVLIILEPVAISTDHLFRWGEPPHVYKIKAVEGLIQNEETGTRYASEVIR